MDQAIQNYRSESDEEEQQYIPKNTKSTRKSNNEDYVPRFDAHGYENKIQELTEKIDILEKRLTLATDQKIKVVNRLKNFEEENDMLKEQISRQNEVNKKTSMEKSKCEKKNT